MRFCAFTRLSPAILLAAAGAARAQCYGQQLIAGDPQAVGHNGEAVAMDGDYVLLGCPDKNTPQGNSAGEVYAYSTFGTQWGQVTHFFPSDPHANDDFGASVAMGGQQQWCIVGAPGQASNAGAAYIFRRDTSTNLWNQLPKLATGSSAGDWLGASVGMNKAGTIAVVGVPYSDVTDIFGTTVEAGKALVYVRSGNTWSYQANLHQTDASVRATGDHLGTGVACDGNRVVTGVPDGDAPGLSNCGYISIWTPDINNYWTATGQIFSPTPGPGASPSGTPVTTRFPSHATPVPK